MIKQCCELCGAGILEIKKQGDLVNLPELCPGCQKTQDELKKCGDEIRKVAADVAISLRLKGVDLRAEVEALETKLVERFLETGKALVRDHFASLEARKEGANGSGASAS